MNNLAKSFLPFLCTALLQYVLVCLEMPAFSGCLHSDRVAVWIVSSHASQSSVSQRRCLCILYVTGKNDVSAQTGLPTLAAEWYFSMSGARALHSYAVLHSLLMINGEIDYPVMCTDRRGSKITSSRVHRLQVRSNCCSMTTPNREETAGREGRKDYAMMMRMSKSDGIQWKHGRLEGF